MQWSTEWECQHADQRVANLLTPRRQREDVIKEVERVAMTVRDKCEARSQVATTRRSRRFKTWPHDRTGNIELRVGAAAADKEDDAVIIFDWDDTLFPTWHVSEVVKTTDFHNLTKISEDSEFYGPLASHAKLLRETLIEARKAARVAIVTLAAKGWVKNSADCYLPGLDIQDLFEKLDIKVYYAREHVSRTEKWQASVEEGVDLYMIAKRNAMKRCLRKLSRCKLWRQIGNVISIGDSTTEAAAIREIMWDFTGAESCLKIIKLVDNPSLPILRMQLQVLKSRFQRMVAFTEDVYISMDSDPSTSRLVQALMGS